MKLYFFQCQESYGNSIYLPYSSGILWSYVRQFDVIKDNYVLGDIFFEKLPVEDYVGKVKDPDVFLFSNYGWNTAYHLSLLKEFKKLYPNALFIVGGPNAQQKESYLREHSYIDYTVWGEGEQSLLELLTAIANKTDIKEVPGIAFLENDNYVKTTTRVRKTDLTDIPSPYLTGVFDDYFVRYPHYNFMPIWETHRGCPYHCTFCDLGADYYNKVYIFELDRLLKEIDWFSEHKVEYMEVADPNFGIFPRDLDIVKYIKKKYVETGFPQKVSATWAKNSPERLFEMSKILDSINRGGVTLALQSQNKTALGNIKRINIANDQLETIAKRYIDLGIPTYHDFILGLPGETLESWIDGISTVIDINPEGWIFGHPLEAYENTEFRDPAYIEKYGLKFATTPQIAPYAHRRTDLPLEMGNYVISTNTMNYDDYIQGFMFKYFIILMHGLGWARFTIQGLSEKLQIPRSKIYIEYFNWIRDSNNFISGEFNLTIKTIRNTLENADMWGRQMFGSNDLYWDLESASAIAFEQNREAYFDALKVFVTEKYGAEFQYLAELNDHLIISYDRVYPYVYDDNLVDAPKFNNFQEFCSVIWHRGRRSKQWKTKLTAIQSGEHSKK